MPAARAPARLTARVSGRVQGVGFRAWTRREAVTLGLAGSATNLPDGAVEVIAEGRREDLDALVRRLRSGDAPGHGRSVTEWWGSPQGVNPTFREG